MKMISTEMTQYLIALQDLLYLAYKERKNGNFYGAACLARQYETNVQAELDFWNVGYDYAVSLGLVVDNIGF